MMKIVRGERAADDIGDDVDPGFGLHTLPARWRALPGHPGAVLQLPGSVYEVKEEDL